MDSPVCIWRSLPQRCCNTCEDLRWWWRSASTNMESLEKGLMRRRLQDGIGFLASPGWPGGLCYVLDFLNFIMYLFILLVLKSNTMEREKRREKIVSANMQLLIFLSWENSLVSYPVIFVWVWWMKSDDGSFLPLAIILPLTLLPPGLPEKPCLPNIHFKYLEFLFVCFSFWGGGHWKVFVPW